MLLIVRSAERSKPVAVIFRELVRGDLESEARKSLEKLEFWSCQTVIFMRLLVDLRVKGALVWQKLVISGDLSGGNSLVRERSFIGRP